MLLHPPARAVAPPSHTSDGGEEPGNGRMMLLVNLIYPTELNDAGFVY